VQSESCAQLPLEAIHAPVESQVWPVGQPAGQDFDGQPVLNAIVAARASVTTIREERLM
jgi:hypothetical protein